LRIRGRRIVGGYAEGEALISPTPFSFYGGVDPETSVITERGHPLEGEHISDRVFIFPHGKGSTVGCYIIYRMRRRGTAPAAIINLETEVIIATGCAMARIPLLDHLEVNPLEVIRTGDHVKVHADKGYIEI
jgi:hypothetical protein